MGFFSDVWDGVKGVAGGFLGIHSGIGSGVPQIGPGPDVSAIQEQARALMEQRIGVLRDAFAQAQGRTTDLAASNTQMIDDQAVMEEGSLLSRLSGQGLLRTSVAPNLARGIQADRVRNQLANQAALAQQRIGLDIGQGQAVAGAQADLAGSILDMANSNRSYFLNREGLRLGRDQYVTDARQQRAAQLGDSINSYIGLGAGLATGGLGGGGGGGGGAPRGGYRLF